MKKKKLILSIVAAAFMLFILVIIVNINSEYILEETITDNWIFLGGRISVNGTRREFEYYGIDYIGSEELKINKIIVEMRAYHIFSNSNYEVLSFSSIGGEELWIINDGFIYGAGSGKTHAIDVLWTYLLNRVELQISLVDNANTENIMIKIPIKSFQ